MATDKRPHKMNFHDLSEPEHAWDACESVSECMRVSAMLAVCGIAFWQ